MSFHFSLALLLASLDFKFDDRNLTNTSISVNKLLRMDGLMFFFKVISICLRITGLGNGISFFSPLIQIDTFFDEHSQLKSDQINDHLRNYVVVILE